jgi:soluble lytic murein transglycosylase
VRRATVLAATALLLGLGRPASAGLAEAQRAFDAGDLAAAADLAGRVDPKRTANPDYLLWIRAQAAFLLGDPSSALLHFTALQKLPGSRFAAIVPWRIADCLWELGDRQKARAAYEKLLAAGSDGEHAVARMRIALAHRDAGRKAQARAGLRQILLKHPAHPLAEQAAAELRALGGDAAAALSPAERVARAQLMSDAHLWDEAIAELRLVPDDVPAAVRRDRDFWTGATLFAMRRRYEDAGRILLAVYPRMGARSDWALFHGARALSRANKDPEAIVWYQKMVATRPGSTWAPEAQYLSGWLEFNAGRYRESIAPLARMQKLYPASKWARDARWFLAFAHYRLGELAQALPLFEEFGRQGGALEGGKGRYWQARTLEQLDRAAEALPIYRALVSRYPFSWYALLARARLAERGVGVDPFGVAPGGQAPTATGPAIAETVDESLAADPIIRAVDELIAGGLPVEGALELRRNERTFLGRHPRPAAFAMVLDRYGKAREWNRPWYLAITHGEAALDAPARGRARVWWQHAYPLAYHDLVDKHRAVGQNPPYWLESIMRKESGYDPHVLSYADAYGLLQMIPPTTRRVARALGIPYTNDLLWDPEANIRTGSWYIGRLLAKFKGQAPIGAGAYNSGPSPWMRWLDQWGDRPMDEFIELIPFRQTREYAKKVTENYARYIYLYDDKVYEQPLTVDRTYVVDDLTY